MKWISTTIKRKWIDKILSGEKKREYKEHSDFWQKRLDPLLNCNEDICINFLCGQESYKFKVLYIEYVNVTWSIDIDGKICNEYYSIYIGDRIE